MPARTADVVQTPQVVHPRSGADRSFGIPAGPGRLPRLLLMGVGCGALVVVFLLLPGTVGTTWSDVGRLLAAVPPLTLVGLTALWVTTLVAHAIVQVAALPGLGVRRAMTLNMSSSAVSSAVPFGGPVSLALNWAMLRSWGFDRHQFSSYTLVTTVVSAVVRLLVPVAAALVLLASGRLPAEADQIGGVAAAALLAICALVAALALPPLRRRLANASHHRRLGRLARDADVAIGRSFTVIRRRWRGLLGGSAAQIALQYLLLWSCFAATDAGIGPVVALVAFGAGRLMSVLPVTPGGLGVSEAAVGALLTALGADAGSTIAALLLFAFYMVVIDVPLGALAVLLWRAGGARLVALPAT